MEEELGAVGAANVTWVYCANREAISTLSKQELRCIHPCIMPTPWTSGQPLSVGVLSLALKHKIAAMDMIRRGLPSALILEDDSALPLSLWESLHQRTRIVPTGAGILFIGSYRSQTDSLQTVCTAQNSSCHHTDVGTGRPAQGLVYWRNTSHSPLIIGSIAYVLYARGAHQALAPVVAPADVALSYDMHNKQDATAADDEAARARIRAEIGAHSCSSNASLMIPAPQYASGQWLITPNLELDQGTHADINGSVQHLLWWRLSKPGVCATTTWKPNSDTCEQGVDTKGSWHTMRHSPPIRSWSACAARCQRCPRCNYISYSAAERDCSWYTQCDMLNTSAAQGKKAVFAGDRFRSMRVRDPEGKASHDWSSCQGPRLHWQLRLARLSACRPRVASCLLRAVGRDAILHPSTRSCRVEEMCRCE